MKLTRKYTTQLILFVGLLVLSPTRLLGQNLSNLHVCSVLPFYDDTQEFNSVSLFESVNSEIQKTFPCVLKRDDRLNSIFFKYKSKLAQFLKNENVIKTFSQKNKAGSVFRIYYKPSVSKNLLEFDAFVGGTSDLLISQKWTWDEEDAIEAKKQAFERIKDWLKLYASKVPYDGVVLERNKNIATVFVQTKKLDQNSDIVFSDFISVDKNTNNELIDIKKKKIGAGRVIKKDRKIVLVEFDENLPVKIGSWVKKSDIKERERFVLEDERDQRLKGRKGAASFLVTSSGSSPVGFFGASDSGVSGAFGIAVDGLYYWGKYYADILLQRRVGDLDFSSTSISSGTVNLTISEVGGYFGRTFGNRDSFAFIDLFAGINRYTYFIDSIQSSGLDDFIFTSPQVGARIHFPRFFEKLDSSAYAKYAIGTSFKEKSGRLGEAKTTSNLDTGFNLRYEMTSTVGIKGVYKFLTNKVEFKNIDAKITFEESLIGLGVEVLF